jgi:Rieske Fe-S protein
VSHRWSSQDNQPADSLPYVGRVTPFSDRLLTATGFRKWGLTNGTAAALMLADEVLDRPNPWRGTFDSNRLHPRAAAPSLVKENADVAACLVGDRLRLPAAPDAGKLRPGEGAIARLNGRRVAAYRDEDGELHAVSPSCTHLGCLVRFNDAERSWDCPCHGSRFGVDGRVLQGPAVRELDRLR